MTVAYLELVDSLSENVKVCIICQLRSQIISTYSFSDNIVIRRISAHLHNIVLIYHNSIVPNSRSTLTQNVTMKKIHGIIKHKLLSSSLFFIVLTHNNNSEIVLNINNISQSSFVYKCSHTHRHVVHIVMRRLDGPERLGSIARFAE